jgi:hypothetical protein
MTNCISINGSILLLVVFMGKNRIGMVNLSDSPLAASTASRTAREMLSGTRPSETKVKERDSNVMPLALPSLSICHNIAP